MTSQEVAIPEAAPVTLFGANDPRDVVEAASRHAVVLKDVLKERELYKIIGKKAHVLVEGWTLLGSMVGVYAIVEWTRRLEDPEGWEARAVARTRSGDVVGAAEAQCTRAENMWSFEPIGKNGRKLEARDDYALRSMAQTRAVSKALRGPLGFIVHLAGYQVTPAEEMPVIDGQAQPTSSGGRKPSGGQHAKLNAMCAELDKKAPRKDGSWEDYSRRLAYEMFQVESRADLKSGEMTQLITRVKEEAELLLGAPFE